MMVDKANPTDALDAPDPLPPEIRRAALRLSRRSGVVGVFLGHGLRKGQWGPERSLVVHVTRKVHALHLSRAQRLPERLGPYRVDVLKVGTPHAHALDASDEILAPGKRVRTGSFTALLQAERGAIALLSGHVGLPQSDEGIVTEYDDRDDPPFRLSAVDAMTARRHVGPLMRGRISARADWALALFPSATGEQLDSAHPIAGVAPPFPVRGAPLTEGEGVRHFSRERGEVRGRFVHGALSAVDVRLDDGSMHTYAGLLAIKGESGAFSVGGDSGSLVFDLQNRAVGTVLGGAEDGTLSYVLPVDGLRLPLASRFDDFFRE
jgi:hypothetical protein